MSLKLLPAELSWFRYSYALDNFAKAKYFGQINGLHTPFILPKLPFIKFVSQSSHSVNNMTTAASWKCHPKHFVPSRASLRIDMTLQSHCKSCALFPAWEHVWLVFHQAWSCKLYLLYICGFPHIRGFHPQAARSILYKESV